MQQKIKVKRSEIRGIIAATFPEYSGRKFEIAAAERVTFYDLNWDGGTRNQYRACTIEGQAVESKVDMNRPAPWANPTEGKSAPLPEGFVVVEHSMFCGRDSGLTVYVNPANMPRLLGGAR